VTGAKGDFDGANSLDSFFTRPDHSVDWLLWSDEAAAVTANSWKSIDTVLMGPRRTRSLSDTARPAAIRG